MCVFVCVMLYGSDGGRKDGGGNNYRKLNLRKRDCRVLNHGGEKEGHGKYILVDLNIKNAAR